MQIEMAENHSKGQMLTPSPALSIAGKKDGKSLDGWRFLRRLDRVTNWRRTAMAEFSVRLETSCLQ
jgi:hypothetical protein